MLIQAGTHAKMIQRRPGHAQVGITLNTYGHLMEGLDESAAEPSTLPGRVWLTDHRRTKPTPQGSKRSEMCVGTTGFEPVTSAV